MMTIKIIISSKSSLIIIAKDYAACVRRESGYCEVEWTTATPYEQQVFVVNIVLIVNIVNIAIIIIIDIIVIIIASSSSS